MFHNKERKKCKYWSFLDALLATKNAVETFFSNVLDCSQFTVNW